MLEVRVVVGSWLAAGTDGRVGSVLGDCEGLPGWFGFHICFVLPFVLLDTGPRTTLRSCFRIQGKSGGAVGFLLYTWAVKAAQAAQSLLFSAS